ncbi:ABC transporter ATP-binding protein [Acidiferrobacter thiooxydans]|uniref:ABC transporter ATP-binding protein n=1 Tax=Acidiferrobacter thiooxydans TaxID=163359 RepID=UPI000A009289|nr:ABC transporter ATP-binding protein [Acidiferrobacter thiooxydans]UEO00997.1 ABC transporter ATP-binding protein [Acidiferrobacter thiooxydans]
MSAPALSVSHVSKEFTLYHNRAMALKTRFLGLFHADKRQQRERFQALTDVSFDVGQGQSLGLLGHNGSGKSTLLQVIANILTPTSGHVIARGRVAPLIQLGVGFNPELTGYENVFLNASLYGFRNREVRKRLEAIVEFAELSRFIDSPLKHYSSGMQMRLGFAVAVHLEPDIVLADEILSVGDQAFQEKCLTKIAELRRNGMTLLLVSHSPDQVNKFCDYYVRLDKGRVIEEGRITHKDARPAATPNVRLVHPPETRGK